MRKYGFYIFTVLVAVSLLVLSRVAKDRTTAIVAEVDAQKTAISFPKSVRIKALYVQPGQEVQKGEKLLEVERPDLLFDIEKLKHERSIVQTEYQKQIEKIESDRQIETLDHQREMAGIDERVLTLTQSWRNDSIVFAEVSRVANTDSTTAYLVYRTALNNLEKERQIRIKAHRATIQSLNNQLRLATEARVLSENLIDDELKVLQQEQDQLVQLATFNGTVGTMNVQLDELIPPYETILSVYENNPNLIKAYINELSDTEVHVGDKVLVESINRSYSIEGVVVEFGARIVALPRQMNPNTTIEMWGRELFVEIPRENSFLNGEKVFVILNN